MIRRSGSFPGYRPLSCALLSLLALALPNAVGAQPGPEQRVIASDPDDSDRFGHSVDIFADIAVIGAPGDDEEATNAGAAYVFHYANGTWTEIQKLTAGLSADQNDEFGYDVSVARNLIAVGARWDDDAGNDAGAVYVYEWNGTTWEEIEKLLPDDVTNTAYEFGTALDIGISIPDEGNHPEQTNIAIGAPRADAFDGVVFLFNRTSSVVWTRIGRFNDSDVGANENGQTGTSVAIRGDSLLAGGPTNDEPQPLNDVGAAYHFGRGQILNSWVETAQLYPGTPIGGETFGQSVAVDNLGQEYVLVVGAPRSSAVQTGSVIVHDASPMPQTFTTADAHQYGRAVAIDQGQIVVGALGEDTGSDNSGAIFFIERDEFGDWSAGDMVKASDASGEKQFGAAVAYRNSSLIVGSPQFGTIPGPGAAYLYTSGIFFDGFETGDLSAW